MRRRYGAICLALGGCVLALSLGGCGGFTPSRGATHGDHTAPRIDLLQPRVYYGTPAVPVQAQSRLRGFDVVRKTEPVAKPVAESARAPLIVSGRVTDDTGVSRLFINGHEVPVEPDGQFSTQVALGVGEHTVRIRATDTYNNVSDIAFTVVVGN